MTDAHTRRKMLRTIAHLRVQQHIGPKHAAKFIRRMDHRVNAAHFNNEMRQFESDGNSFPSKGLGSSITSVSMKDGMKNKLSKKGGNK